MQSEYDLVLDYQRFGRRGFEDLAGAMSLVGVGASRFCHRNERREHGQSFELEVCEAVCGSGKYNALLSPSGFVARVSCIASIRPPERTT
jgi:hypothetical protein